MGALLIRPVITIGQLTAIVVKFTKVRVTQPLGSDIELDDKTIIKPRTVRKRPGVTMAYVAICRSH